MKNHAFMILAFTGLMSQSCTPVLNTLTKRDDNSVSVDSAKVAETGNHQGWSMIQLPVENATALVGDGNLLLAIGADGIAAIGPNNGAQKRAVPAQLADFLSKDGGLTLISELRRNGASKNNSENSREFCDPESAAVSEGRLYVFALCEHTSQVWSVDLTDSQSHAFLTEFTYSTYPKSNADDTVFGPTSVAKVGNAILFPAALESGPAILKLDTRIPAFRLIWKGGRHEGVLLSVSFADEVGKMLMSDGSILVSEDLGKTWKHFGQIPPQYVGKVWRIAFADLREGYIAGENGIVLQTRDGGKTWIKAAIDTDGSIYDVAVDRNRAVIVADFKTILTNEKGGIWHRLDFAAGGRIEDVEIHKGRLFVLSRSKLYVQ